MSVFCKIHYDRRIEVDIRVGKGVSPFQLGIMEAPLNGGPTPLWLSDNLTRDEIIDMALRLIEATIRPVGDEIVDGKMVALAKRDV